MQGSSERIERVIEELTKLPTIGRKTAQRLALYILKTPRDEVNALADAILEMRRKVRFCTECGALTEDELCAICADARRDRHTICVVEEPGNVISIEKTGEYRGLYHVLHGRLSPLDGVGPEQLTIDKLVKRVQRGQFQELIMATNPTVEGDGTALHISNLLREHPVRITRLARGITTGSILEYTNKEILADAMTGRQPL